MTDNPADTFTTKVTMYRNHAQIEHRMQNEICCHSISVELASSILAQLQQGHTTLDALVHDEIAHEDKTG